MVAALGVSMHSGWGILVAVSSDAKSVQILHRARIVVTDPALPGATQPYHHAALLALPEAERHLAACAAASASLASAAIARVVHDLEARGRRIAGAAVLLASGRPLPPLAKILAAHPLIHTAEGEFFRNAVIQACEHLRIPVTAIRARDLEITPAIATLGALIGPPWTKDHKLAASAAARILTCPGPA